MFPCFLRRTKAFVAILVGALCQVLKDGDYKVRALMTLVSGMSDLVVFVPLSSQPGLRQSI